MFSKGFANKLAGFKSEILSLLAEELAAHEKSSTMDMVREVYRMLEPEAKKCIHPRFEGFQLDRQVTIKLPDVPMKASKEASKPKTGHEDLVGHTQDDDPVPSGEPAASLKTPIQPGTGSKDPVSSGAPSAVLSICPVIAAVETIPQPAKVQLSLCPHIAMVETIPVAAQTLVNTPITPPRTPDNTPPHDEDQEQASQLPSTWLANGKISPLEENTLSTIEDVEEFKRLVHAGDEYAIGEILANLAGPPPDEYTGDAQEAAHVSSSSNDGDDEMDNSDQKTDDEVLAFLDGLVGEAQQPGPSGVPSGDHHNNGYPAGICTREDHQDLRARLINKHDLELTAEEEKQNALTDKLTHLQKELKKHMLREKELKAQLTDFQERYKAREAIWNADQGLLEIAWQDAQLHEAENDRLRRDLLHANNACYRLEMMQQCSESRGLLSDFLDRTDAHIMHFETRTKAEYARWMKVHEERFRTSNAERAEFAAQCKAKDVAIEDIQRALRGKKRELALAETAKEGAEELAKIVERRNEHYQVKNNGLEERLAELNNDVLRLERDAQADKLLLAQTEKKLRKREMRIAFQDEIVAGTQRQHKELTTSLAAGVSEDSLVSQMSAHILEHIATFEEALSRWAAAEQDFDAARAQQQAYISQIQLQADQIEAQKAEVRSVLVDLGTWSGRQADEMHRNLELEEELKLCKTALLGHRIPVPQLSVMPDPFTCCR
ncbi:MAG: hypothetical protein M1817_006344 [Caeruleum heppii]|nr:MAG: hypothetical protein M1817_006344 [Caeruleum heppii]